MNKLIKIYSQMYLSFIVNMSDALLLIYNFCMSEAEEMDLAIGNINVDDIRIRFAYGEIFKSFSFSQNKLYNLQEMFIF